MSRSGAHRGPVDPWRARLIRALGGVVPDNPKKTYVEEPGWERAEELRVDRLGPTEDDLRQDDPEWTPPEGLQRDPFAPRRTLGPLRQ